jgi:hypothetical protein
MARFDSTAFAQAQVRVGQWLWSRGGALCGLAAVAMVVRPFALALWSTSPNFPSVMLIEVSGFVAEGLFVLGIAMAVLGAIVRTAGREPLAAK